MKTPDAVTEPGQGLPLRVEDYAALARERLADDVWSFIQGGSGTEHNVTSSRPVLDQLLLRPRHLVDVSKRDLSTSAFGQALAMPFGIAPMAYHCLAHPEGETATARAAMQLGALFIVSMFASQSLEEIAGAGSAPRWLQVYWLRRRDVLLSLVDRAEKAGFQALVLTIDAPWVARRLRDVRNGFALPTHVRAVNLDPSVMSESHAGRPGTSAIERHSKEQFDPTITWSDLAWLRERTRLPLVLKGILTAEDARKAVDNGARAIFVSNHGGRQLDGAIPGICALPEIVSAVAGACPVFIDGGIRSGADVLRVMALGADLAFIGRPVLWGLAHSGSEGVAHVLRIVRDELEEDMVLMGRPRLADIDHTAVSVRPEWPGATAPFVSTSSRGARRAEPGPGLGRPRSDWRSAE